MGGASTVWGGPTRWSVIRAAAGRDPSADAGEAWRALLARYRTPVRKGLARRLPGEPVEDVVNDFFAYLFARGLLESADPAKGRFRCFAQVVMRNFALAYSRTSRARGVVLPDEDALPSIELELDLEAREESEWAEEYLARALERLREAHPRDAELLLRADGSLGHAQLSTPELCELAGLNRNALYQALFKARRRLRSALEQEIADTVQGAEDLEAEIRFTIERLLEAHPGLLAESKAREPGGEGDVPPRS